MACTVSELRVYLSGWDGDDMIGIDEGGLNLIIVAPKGYDDPKVCTKFPNGDGEVLALSYFEIGGIPLDDEDKDDDYDPSSDFDRYTCTADKGDCNCEACRKAK